MGWSWKGDWNWKIRLHLHLLGILNRCWGKVGGGAGVSWACVGHLPVLAGCHSTTLQPPPGRSSLKDIQKTVQNHSRCLSTVLIKTKAEWYSITLGATHVLKQFSAMWCLIVVTIVVIQSWRCVCWAGQWQLASQTKPGCLCPTAWAARSSLDTNLWQQYQSESRQWSDLRHLWRQREGPVVCAMRKRGEMGN